MSEYTKLTKKRFGRCCSCGTDWIASDANIEAFAEAIRRKTLEEVIAEWDKPWAKSEGKSFEYRLRVMAQEGVTK